MNRAVGEHSLNNYSSRSHCIFTLHIDSRSLTHSSSSFTVSKLTLVDLAGSERLNKTQVCKNTITYVHYTIIQLPMSIRHRCTIIQLPMSIIHRCTRYIYFIGTSMCNTEGGHPGIFTPPPPHPSKIPPPPEF